MWNERRAVNLSQRNGDHRTSYQRDKARILHSAAFRRLQAKTQVLGVGMSDFYRTRLTHSLEASQIGQGIAAQLRSKYPELTNALQLNDHLIEALCLAHDIGHPPYGHGGEIALHYMMHQHGGFEGNGQTFRIVSNLEPYTAEFGMNLSRRTILGLVKYPNYLEALTNSECHPQDLSQINHRTIKASDWHPPKGLYRCDQDVFDWLMQPFSHQDRDLFSAFTTFSDKHAKTQFKSFDCSIMELADDIAYGIHDLEDAIVMGIIRYEQFVKEVVSPIKSVIGSHLGNQIEQIATNLFSQFHHERKDAIGALVNHFITAIEIDVVHADFDEDVLKYNAVLPSEHHQTLDEFKGFVYRRVIKKPEIQLLEYKGQQVVIELFEAFASDPERLLPENTRARWEKACKRENGHRVIADYISGMTDGFAARLYGNLFLPKNGSLQDNHGN